MCHLQTQKINALHWPGINTLKTHHDKITSVVYPLIKQLWLLLLQKELAVNAFLISVNQSKTKKFVFSAGSYWKKTLPFIYFSQPIKDQEVCFLCRLVLKKDFAFYFFLL